MLKVLQHNFPQIQFIVTTHAPMVISSVESRSKMWSTAYGMIMMN
ncbi:hypothetical protein EVA_04292 [gut metagenome]|uniref:ATPase AAA-type core domain-containing protein n=1 Tax=gut metagenome TaxID=749906 RepID=J9GJZ1_9ZZZZ